MPAKKKVDEETLTEEDLEELKERIDALQEEQDELTEEVVKDKLDEESKDPQPYGNANITTYAHHGTMVQVRKDLKGKHRQHSMCYYCDKFKPDTLNNCHIAQAIYDNCVKFHVTTPVWECPSFNVKEKS